MFTGFQSHGLKNFSKSHTYLIGGFSLFQLLVWISCCLALVMRRYSPPYYSPLRRGYGGRARSPPRRGYGRSKEQNNGSLLVRNIPLDCRPEELRVPFERFGLVRDVYIPRDYHTGEPRGFAFVQFVDPYEAAEAQYHMNRAIFAGREITVVVAAETRKRPEEMRRRSSVRGTSVYGGRQSRYGRSRSRSVSRSRSPHYPSGSRSRHRSRSYSPAPRHRADYSISPNRRQADHARSPREPPKERDSDHGRRLYSPGYENDGDEKQNVDAYGKKAAYDSDEARRPWKSSPGRASRSPSGSRSRSADLSP